MANFNHSHIALRSNLHSFHFCFEPYCLKVLISHWIRRISLKTSFCSCKWVSLDVKTANLKVITVLQVYRILKGCDIFIFDWWYQSWFCTLIHERIKTLPIWFSLDLMKSTHRFVQNPSKLKVFLTFLQIFLKLYWILLWPPLIRTDQTLWLRHQMKDMMKRYTQTIGIQSTLNRNHAF